MTTRNIGLSKARRIEIEDETSILLVELWKKHSPSNPLSVVSPGLALEHLGFRVGSTDLGQEYIDGRLSDVAGMINFEQQEVWISTRSSREEQFFTAAHELGHARLHSEHRGLHRDRPVKGPSVRRDIKEIEADYFASCFLMPTKQIRRRFVDRFQVDEFHLNQNTAFSLCGSTRREVRSHIKSVRELSRLLAECIQFNGTGFSSLKSVFQVSTEAMAIRLEELRMVGEFSLDDTYLA